MYTTLNLIHKHGPCQRGWKQLMGTLKKELPDDTPLAMVTVLESNGPAHTIWAMKTVPEFGATMRYIALAFASEVEPWFTEKYPCNDKTRTVIAAVNAGELIYESKTELERLIKSMRVYDSAFFAASAAYSTAEEDPYVALSTTYFYAKQLLNVEEQTRIIKQFIWEHFT